MTEKRLTTCCGLYCPDCIPSNKAFFEVVGKLSNMLTELNFDKYADYKAKNNAVFANYSAFAAVLQAMKDLECGKLCGDGGGKPDCAAKKCAQNKGYGGCWECGDSHECAPLAPLRANHIDLEHNLAMIREHGIDKWPSQRGRHYRWDKAPQK